MKDPYKVLGVSPTASDEEIKAAYRDLTRRFHPDRYVNDEAGRAHAEEKMKEINEAYSTIARMRSRQTGGAGNLYAELRQMINQGRYAEAEQRLDGIPQTDRPAEWHYLKSIVLMRRGWVNDSLQEIEIACAMAPENTEYHQARESFTRRAAAFGNHYTNGRGQPAGGECTTCDMCSGLICADCCCESMGFDLIRCI